MNTFIALRYLACRVWGIRHMRRAQLGHPVPGECSALLFCSPALLCSPHRSSSSPPRLLLTPNLSPNPKPPRPQLPRQRKRSPNRRVAQQRISPYSAFVRTKVKVKNPWYYILNCRHQLRALVASHSILRILLCTCTLLLTSLSPSVPKAPRTWVLHRT